MSVDVDASGRRTGAYTTLTGPRAQLRGLHVNVWGGLKPYMLCKVPFCILVIVPSAGSSWLVGEVGGRAGRRAVHGWDRETPHGIPHY